MSRRHGVYSHLWDLSACACGFPSARAMNNHVTMSQHNAKPATETFNAPGCLTILHVQRPVCNRIDSFWEFGTRPVLPGRHLSVWQICTAILVLMLKRNSLRFYLLFYGWKCTRPPYVLWCPGSTGFACWFWAWTADTNQHRVLFTNLA